MRMTTFLLLSFFFFTDTATTEIYTLSLHDALPICTGQIRCGVEQREQITAPNHRDLGLSEDRKSTRLNSSHVEISYAVFCLKKKKKIKIKQDIIDQQRIRLISNHATNSVDS